MSTRHLISDVFLWLGVGLNLLACLGVLALRDVFVRLHFASPAVLGAVCIAVAVLVKESFSTVADNTILVAVFIVVVSQVVTHAAARAARIDATGDWRLSPEDGVEVEES